MQRRIIDKKLLDARLSGIGLAGEARERFNAIVQELSQLSTDFSNHVLDATNSAWLLQQVYDLLEPGGQVVFYESNPWNPVLKLRRLFARLIGSEDPRSLLSRPQLYELVSEIGFIRVFAVYNDFVYAPLSRRMAWLLRNLSIILENTPGARRLAGSILLQAQKPPRTVPRARTILLRHNWAYTAFFRQSHRWR